MSDENFQEKLRKQLHILFPEAKDCGGGREVSINCPLCNQSGMPDHGNHMYISLGDNDKPPMYNCFRNIEHRGVLTKSLLEQFTQTPQCVDSGLMEEMEKHIKTASNLSAYRLNKNKKYGFFIPIPNKNKINDYKLGYINQRLGIHLDYKDLPDLKIVLSLGELLRYNHIEQVTRTPYIIDFINAYFVGFMTNTNGVLIMRNLADLKNNKKIPQSLQTRYVKYNIVQNALSGYYVLPTQCNLYHHIDLRIAEGTFDILSVFYNVCGGNRIDNIYASIGGNTYLSAVRYFISTLGLIDVTVHLYIDNDILNSVLSQIKRIVCPLADVIIHMNTFAEEKDFGVSPDRIQEYTYKL